jgi:2-phosphosulfolactate phosphatase
MPAPVPEVDVALTPALVAPEGRTCLVVDVLRATSVMAVLFGRGLQALYPAASTDSARETHAALASEGERPLLIGEEHALPPEGFDYGNSPSEFAALEVLPVSAVAATTNGTPALLACITAELTMPAAPLNASAVVGRAEAAGHPVTVVCAGLRGEPADDDLLAAGLLVERLVRMGARPGPEAAVALARYEAVSGDFAGAFRAAEHGQILVERGFGHDLEFCATADRYDVAAALDASGERPVIRPLQVE